VLEGGPHRDVEVPGGAEIQVSRIRSELSSALERRGSRRLEPRLSGKAAGAHAQVILRSPKTCWISSWGPSEDARPDGVAREILLGLLVLL